MVFSRKTAPPIYRLFQQNSPSAADQYRWYSIIRKSILGRTLLFILVELMMSTRTLFVFTCSLIVGCSITLTSYAFDDAALVKAKEAEKIGAIFVCEGCDLSGADLSGMYLYEAKVAGANFSSANLEGANIQGADLTGANFDNARLVKTKLSGSFFTNASLRQSDLSGGSRLDHADFTSADLSGANLNQAKLKRTNLTGAILRQVNLGGADLYKVKFDQADLTKATFLDAVFEGIILDNAKVCDTVLPDGSVSNKDC